MWPLMQSTHLASTSGSGPLTTRPGCASRREAWDVRAPGGWRAWRAWRAWPGVSGATILVSRVALRSGSASWQRGLPNVLTALRVLAVIPTVALFYTWTPACCGVFVAASLTDFLDGYLARRWKVCSPFGKFLDPVADKLLTCAVLVLLPTATFEVAPPRWLLVVPAVLIILREIFISALREWTAAAGESNLTQVGFLGKAKTAVILISLCGLLASCRQGLKSKLFSGCVALLYLGALLAYLSSIGYVRNALPAFRRASNTMPD
ncbi:unnamed protein product [Effrenium voratum]|uniref:CDP-diacylglycerol--glycerol-3-phosphate 3-phosphatidyltransferase n=1 Tax=Effrenium voratum TaxID=2562239 RepID=A0AA36HV45_9DINO|nr:unnamed protein product [Effrenium voratum]CAJ1375009.1 unnamed protein product [Effrenium voratum]